MPDSDLNNLNGEKRFILEYGKAEPALTRFIKRIPRLSKLTFALLVIAGIGQTWFWLDHEPWVMQRALPHAAHEFAGRIFPTRDRIITDTEPISGVGVSPYHVSNVATGETICTLQSTYTTATHLAISPDGSRILAAMAPIKITSTSVSGTGTDPEIQLFDANTGNLLKDFGPSAGWGMFFSPDGKLILQLNGPNTILYDSAKGSRCAILQEKNEHAPYYFFTAAFFSADSKLVALRAQDMLIHVYSLPDGNLISQFRVEHPAIGTTLDIQGFFDSNSTFIFGENDWIERVDATTGTVAVPSIKLGGNFYGICPSPDSSQLAIIHDAPIFPQRILTVVDSKTLKVIASTPPSQPNVLFGFYLTWFPDQSQIALYGPGCMEIFDAKSLRQISSRNMFFPTSNSGVVFSPDGSKAATIGPNGPWIQVFSVPDLRVTSTVGKIRSGAWRDSFSDAIFLQDSKHLLTTTDQGTVQLWRLRRPEAMWGIICLPQFWFAFVAGFIFAWSLIRDLRYWFGYGNSPAH